MERVAEYDAAEDRRGRHVEETNPVSGEPESC